MGSSFEALSLVHYEDLTWKILSVKPKLYLAPHIFILFKLLIKNLNEIFYSFNKILM